MPSGAEEGLRIRAYGREEAWCMIPRAQARCSIMNSVRSRNPRVAKPTIQADTCDSGGIREISGDCWLLAALQNFAQRLTHF